MKFAKPKIVSPRQVSRPKRIPKGSVVGSKGPPAQAGAPPHPNKPLRPDYDRASVLRGGGHRARGPRK